MSSSTKPGGFGTLLVEAADHANDLAICRHSVGLVANEVAPRIADLVVGACTSTMRAAPGR